MSSSTAATEPSPIAFTDATGIAIPVQGCLDATTPGCYTNYAITADLDGDGNLDLVMANGGGHFTSQAAEDQAIYFGDGRGSFAVGTSAFVNLAKSTVRQVAVADFDGDGRLDVFMPGAYNRTKDQLFYQRAPKAFENDPLRFAGGPLSSKAGAVHAGDIDGDGDIDIVIADWGIHPNPDASIPPSPVTVRLYINDGAGRFSAGSTYAAPGGSSSTDIDLADVDGDFDLDIVLTNRNGQSRLYINDGAGAFTDATESLAFPPKQGPFSFNAELCDFDNDGDLDLFFDGTAQNLPGHSSQVLVNDGTGRFADESLRISGEPRTDDNQVKCADLDGDGFLDLVVASLGNTTEKLLKNDGTGHFVNIPKAFPVRRDPTLAVDIGDFNNDGRLDVFTAQGEVPGQSWFERIYLASSATAVDMRPPTFRAVEHPAALPGHPIVVRFAVVDAHTSETGQHVTGVGLDVTIAGKTQTIAATFIGGDLFRAVIPPAAAGATLKVIPHATDRAGNTAQGASFDLVLPVPHATH